MEVHMHGAGAYAWSRRRADASGAARGARHVTAMATHLEVALLAEVAGQGVCLSIAMHLPRRRRAHAHRAGLERLGALEDKPGVEARRERVVQG